MEKSLSKLYARAWINSTTRFNAVRRLRRRDTFATYSIAMFSAMALSIAVSQKVFPIKQGSPIDNYLTALSAFPGLFVLVISLIEASEQSLVKAYQLEVNALNLRDLMYKIEFRIDAILEGHLSTQQNELGQLREEYEKIIQTCPQNHEPVDYALTRAVHRTDKRLTKSGNPCSEENPSMLHFSALWVHLAASFSGIGYYLLFWLIILALIVQAIFGY